MCMVNKPACRLEIFSKSDKWAGPDKISFSTLELDYQIVVAGYRINLALLVFPEINKRSLLNYRIIGQI